MRLSPRSVRGKAVLWSGLAITVFGLVIGFASYLFVSQSTLTSTSEVLSTQVNDISDQLAEQTSSDVDPIDLEPPSSFTPILVQLVTPDGQVLESSSALGTDERICTQPPPSSPTSDRVTLTLAGTSGGFLRQAAQVTTSRGDVVVCAAASDQPIERAQEAVLLSLLIALPLLVLGVCIVVWLAVGRALHAVDDMTSQAEAMQSTADGVLRVHPTHDEVERLGWTFNALLARLHQQTDATRQFVADAGHELRNPLSTLRVTLEFGSEGDEPAVRASVRDALTDLDRLEHLVQDLLVLARVDAMEGPKDVEDLDLATLVDEAVSAARRAEPELRIHDSCEPCRVDGTRSALRGLVANLVDNASRHAARNVDVTLRSEGDWAVLRVDDDGAGLRPEDCERVFDRFVRLDESRDRDEGGSGLGLAIVASVAEAHGGHATASAGPGGHFTVRLPLAR